MRVRAFAWATALLMLAAQVASADGTPVERRARDAYERGTAAYEHADYEAAAREFATADALVPNATALRAALDAAVLADDPVLGEELLERARRGIADAALEASLRAAEARFAHRTGRVRFVCPSAPCVAAIDGAAVDASAPHYVGVGPHAATLQSGGGTEQRLFEVHDGEVVTITAAPATVAAPPAAPGSDHAAGVSPAWFFVALGATVAGAAVTTLSALDTASRHDDFVHAGCDRVAAAGCAGLAADGSSAETRTNVALGVTAALTAGTAALGLFAVRWRGAPAATVVASASSLSLRVSFR